MQHLTADDKALILVLRVEKRWNVHKMIYSNFQTNGGKDKHCITWCEKLIKLEVLQGCLAVAGLARSAKT